MKVLDSILFFAFEILEFLSEIQGFFDSFVKRNQFLLDLVLLEFLLRFNFDQLDSFAEFVLEHVSFFDLLELCLGATGALVLFQIYELIVVVVIEVVQSFFTNLIVNTIFVALQSNKQKDN